jgi:hypothetical protein
MEEKKMLTSFTISKCISHANIQSLHHTSDNHDRKFMITETLIINFKLLTKNELALSVDGVVGAYFLIWLQKITVDMLSI